MKPGILLSLIIDSIFITVMFLLIRNGFFPVYCSSLEVILKSLLMFV